MKSIVKGIFIISISTFLYGGENPIKSGLNFMNDFRAGAIATKSTINYNRKKVQLNLKDIIKEDYKKSRDYFKKIKRFVF